MIIFGQVANPEEAAEVDCIAKSFVVANRTKTLAQNSLRI
jgi:hypothetical protein